MDLTQIGLLGTLGHDHIRRLSSPSDPATVEVMRMAAHHRNLSNVVLVGG